MIGITSYILYTGETDLSFATYASSTAMSILGIARACFAYYKFKQSGGLAAITNFAPSVRCLGCAAACRIPVPTKRRVCVHR